MEAQLLAADARFWAVPWSGGGGPVHVQAHGAFGKCADPSNALVVNGHKSPAVSATHTKKDVRRNAEEEVEKKKKYMYTCRLHKKKHLGCVIHAH
jgi:hypothetical protein